MRVLSQGCQIFGGRFINNESLWTPFRRSAKQKLRRHTEGTTVFSFFRIQFSIVNKTMGAQQSVQLSCLVDKLTQSPGEAVKGKVILKVEGQALTSFEGVTITLAGQEYMLVDGQLMRQSIGKIKIQKDVTNFYKRFPKGTVPEGEHEFPFELTLPEEDLTDDEDDDDTVPSLTHAHSRNSSLSSAVSGVSTLDLSRSSTTSYASVMSTGSTVSRQIKYKLRASLKRKKNVGITVDTNHWCEAQIVDSHR